MEAFATMAFFDFWYPEQVVSVQHGNPRAWKDLWLGERASGPESLTDVELQNNRGDQFLISSHMLWTMRGIVRGPPIGVK